MSDAVETKPEPTPPVEEPRRWGWRAYVGLFLLIVLVGCAAMIFSGRAWMREQSEREYVQTRADVERTEPNWNWERLQEARTKPPAGKNSAELIPQIKFHTHKDWGKELNKEKWRLLLEVPVNVRYSPDVIAEVRRDLGDSATAIELARSLKDFSQPGHREIHLKPEVFNTLLENTQNTRLIADLLRWDIVVAAEDGDLTRAVSDLQAMLNGSRSIGDEPSLISQLVRIAVRAVMIRSTERSLAQSANAPQLSELQTALAADAEEPLLLYGFLGERAMFDRFFENLENGALSPKDMLGESEKDLQNWFGWWRYRVHLPADRAASLRIMTQCIEAARLPVHEQPAAFAAIQLPPKDSNQKLTHLLLPSWEPIANAYWRTTAEARCAAAGIACERFRQKHNRWPTDLAELTPAFLPSVPLDPYDGKPLKYTKLNDGVVVHSVGMPHSLQARPELPAGILVGFRLWNPDQRRLPPQEPTPEMPEQPEKP